MYYDMSSFLRNVLKLFLLLCILGLAGLAVFLWSYIPKMAKSPTDITIQSDLQPRLSSLSRASNSNLKVTVGQGTVRLEGTITDQNEHDVVLAVAKQGSGINKIDDALKIISPQARTQEGGYRYQALLSRQSQDDSVTASAN
jgi:hypothetical protein